MKTGENHIVRKKLPIPVPRRCSAAAAVSHSSMFLCETKSRWSVRTIASSIWPHVRGTTIALAMFGAIGALKTFDVPYLVTIGGPNYSTEFLGTYIYRETIPLDHVGYGAALSVVLLVLALAMALLLQIRGRESREGA